LRRPLNCRLGCCVPRQSRIGAPAGLCSDMPPRKDRPPTRDPMQRPAMRIIFANPCLRLGTPRGPHDLLLRAMADFDKGAVARGGSHVAELRKSDRPADLPYLVQIIPVFCFVAVISKCMSDQIIDAATARSIQANAAKANIQFGWIIQHDPPEHPGKYVARFATGHPTIYVIQADTLAELQAMLPPGPGAVTTSAHRSTRGAENMVLSVAQSAGGAVFRSAGRPGH
jgi:hypothetical protein